MPDELWTEVLDIVQETWIKTIPKKKKCKKAKWLSHHVLLTAEKRREAKGEGERERYIHLNAEFQRIARRDKKTFLSDQCKEIEENNRMGKTRDLFKKIRDTKGTFQAKMSTIKDRNHFPDCERTTGSTGEKFCSLLRLHRILGLVGVWVVYFPPLTVMLTALFFQRSI